jgi:hypothetical protein
MKADLVRRNRRIALLSVSFAEGMGLVVEFLGVKGNHIALLWGQFARLDG